MEEENKSVTEEVVENNTSGEVLNSGKDNKKSGKPKKKKIIIGVLILALVLIAGGICAYIFCGNKNKYDLIFDDSLFVQFYLVDKESGEYDRVNLGSILNIEDSTRKLIKDIFFDNYHKNLTSEFFEVEQVLKRK